MNDEILMFIALFATVFGLYFLRSRENMAMIEKGLNPRRRINTDGPRPYMYMKYALLFTGAGIGLFIAYILDLTWLREFTRWTSENGRVHYDDNPAVYFALLAIGGGLGLFAAYKLEKKDMLNKKPDDTTNEV